MEVRGLGVLTVLMDSDSKDPQGKLRSLKASILLPQVPSDSDSSLPEPEPPSA